MVRLWRRPGSWEDVAHTVALDINHGHGHAGQVYLLDYVQNLVTDVTLDSLVESMQPAIV